MSKAEVPLHKRPRVRRIMRQGVADVIENSNFYCQNTFGRPSRENPCETECCIAGFIDWRENPHRHNEDAYFGAINLVEQRVRDLLGAGATTIPPFRVSLFWPKPYSTAFRGADTNEQRALVLRDRVEHWFETGE